MSRVGFLRRARWLLAHAVLCGNIGEEMPSDQQCEGLASHGSLLLLDPVMALVTKAHVLTIEELRQQRVSHHVTWSRSLTSSGARDLATRLDGGIRMLHLTDAEAPVTIEVTTVTTDETPQSRRQPQSAYGAAVAYETATEAGQLPVFQVKIGQSVEWPVPKSLIGGPPGAVGWPSDCSDLHLVKLFCSFYSDQEWRAKTTYARVDAKFSCSNANPPYVVDLDPGDIRDRVAIGRRVTINPTGKFQELELGVRAVMLDISYDRLEPNILGMGQGLDVATWEYRATHAQPSILGGKTMYALIGVSLQALQVKVELSVTATVERPVSPPCVHRVPFKLTRLW